MEILTEYFNVSYVLAVVFGADFLNEFVPGFKKLNNRIATLATSVAFGFLFYWVQSPENTKEYLEVLIVSFLFSVTMYDFIVKPIKSFFKKKSQELDKIQNDDPNFNGN